MDKKFFEQTWLKHTLIIAGIILASQLAAFSFRHRALDTGSKMLAPLTQNVLLEKRQLALVSLPGHELQQLQTLFSVLQNRKAHHETVFLELYQYHFASVTVLLILSSVSAVVIFLVSHRGINNVSPYSRTVFYTMAALTAFYALSPVVYKQSDSIDRNIKCYLQLDNLQNELYDYAVCGPIKRDSMNFNQFHTMIIKKMGDINSINLEFDYKSIPVQEFLKEK